MPCFDGFYRAALRALPFPEEAPLSVLDLGAGTGLLTALVAERFARARITLVDVAAQMLAIARERFADAGDRFDFVHADYAALAEQGPRTPPRALGLVPRSEPTRGFASREASEAGKGLGARAGRQSHGPRSEPTRGFASREASEAWFGGRRDAVVSALSIHHLDADAKRRLFGRILACLVPGGVFVNADQVAGDTPERNAQDRAAWEREARALGSDDAEIAAAKERMREDQPSTVPEQLGWLREAGLEAPACTFRHGMFAVLAARRA